MSIVVKDYDWGTDKLLFSAPVKIIDILFGKLGALLAFCSLFAGILFIYSTSFVLIAGKPEVAAIGVGLLLFVLVSIFYCCWGLLISSCFSSNVLVLIFTFVGLAFFNYVNHIYLSPLLIDFLFLFALDTKNFPFMTGLFSTDTVIWYLGMSVLFFVYTYLNLYRKCYEVKAKALWGNVGFWSILVVGGICFFQNPRHVYYADTTRARQNSITEKSKTLLERIEGEVSLTSYVDIFEKKVLDISPLQKENARRFIAPFLRAKKDIRLQEIYYYDSIPASYFAGKRENLSEREILGNICDINGISSRHLLHLSEIPGFVPEIKGHAEQRVQFADGKIYNLRLYSDVLSLPSEQELATVFGYASCPPVRLGFYGKNSCRSIISSTAKDYTDLISNKRLRSALINQGFDIRNIDENEGVDSLELLFIVDPCDYFSEEETKEVNDFIDAGNNLVIVADGGSIKFLNSLLEPWGFCYESDNLPGNVREYEGIVAAQVSAMGASVSDALQKIYEKGWPIVFTGGNAIGYTSENQNFRCIPLVTVEDSVGIEKTVVALFEREIQGKHQKVVLVGSADWISNGGMTTIRPGLKDVNAPMIYAIVKLLADNQYPLTIERQKSEDKVLLLDLDDIFYFYLFVCLLAIFIVFRGGMIMWKRKIFYSKSLGFLLKHEK